MKGWIQKDREEGENEKAWRNGGRGLGGKVGVGSGLELRREL